MRTLLAIMLALLVGCSPAEHPAPTDAGHSSDSTTADSTVDPDTNSEDGDVDGVDPPDHGPDRGDFATDTGPDSRRDADEADQGDDAVPPFSVPRARGSYDVDFTVSLSGSASDPVGSFSIADGSGTVELDGQSVPIGIYQRQQWDDFGYELFQGLAVDDDRWWIVWFYCQGDDLTDVYYESTDGVTIDYVSADGSCDATDQPSTVGVDFPAGSLAVEPLLDTFTAMGPDLEIRAGEAGVLRTASTDFDVYPFGHVDCTEECGADGWHELHSVLHDPQTGEVCFAIFYLYEDDRYVLVAYTFSLPSLADPTGTLQLADTTWSGP